MIKFLKYLLVFALINISLANAKDLSKVNITDTDARNAVMALNHMHSSLNKIVSYNDKIVLEEEYDNIINNINLTVIKDREIVNVITYLMDTLTTFKLTEMEKEQFQREYQEKLDNAISGALTGISVSGADPISMGISLITSAGSAYMTYKEGQKNAKKGFDKNKWKLKKDTISELNEIRKDFLITYWKIMKKYNMPDKWRITERQFTRFVTILKDDDINKKYRQLLRMKKEMSVFPTYWYELSLVAHKLNKKDDELQAINKYETLDDKLLRHNSYYSLMLANKISYYDYKTEEEEIISMLNKIYDIDPLNAERKLFIAMKYQQMGYTKKAETLLNENIDDSFLPILSQRLKVNMYLKNNKNKDYEDTINSLLYKQNLSASEYLFYLGQRPLSQLVTEIKKETKKIKVIFKDTWLNKDDIYVWLPKKWVFDDVENTELQIDIKGKLYKFENISKDNDYIIYFYKDIIDKNEIIEKEVTDIGLKLIHKGIPLLINYHIKLTIDKEYAADLMNDNAEYNSIEDIINDKEMMFISEKLGFVSIDFIGNSIILRDKCFDLQNELKPCK